MSDTPKTDAAAYQVGTADYDSLGHHHPVMVTPANFARDLERQLTAEREAKEQAEARVARLLGIKEGQIEHPVMGFTLRAATDEQLREAVRMLWDERDVRKVVLTSAESRLAEASRRIIAVEHLLHEIIHEWMKPATSCSHPLGLRIQEARAFLSESTARQEEKG